MNLLRMLQPKRHREPAPDELVGDMEITYDLLGTFMPVNKQKKRRLLKAWPVRTCTECSGVMRNAFGDQMCDACRERPVVDLYTTAQWLSKYPRYIQQHETHAEEMKESDKPAVDKWPLPIVPPASTDRMGAYFQPTPISGFPYTAAGLNRQMNTRTEYWKHPLESRYIFELDGVAARLATPLVFSFAYCPIYISVYKGDWDHVWLDWVNCPEGQECWTEEQLERGRDLLFREPFLQEQPHLGLLMVHPNANKARFAAATADLLSAAAPASLIPDLMRIVLAMAYEDSVLHLD